MKRPSLDRSLAKQNPERIFASPHEIVGETLFTKGEKLATLERWRRSILQELSASNEGMHTRGVSSDRARTLGQIEDAKRDLANGA